MSYREILARNLSAAIRETQNALLAARECYPARPPAAGSVVEELATALEYLESVRDQLPTAAEI